MITAAAVLVAVALGLLALLGPKVRSSISWRATVTPLASIIGSGFLVVAPLLAASVGSWAPLAMAGITVFAYIVGAVVRFNIANLQPVLEDGDPSHAIKDIEHLSDLALGFAYVISVAFYLRLLSSFVLREVGGSTEFSARLLTTALLFVIGLVGWFRGLRGLESVEKTAVAIKLSIILGLFAGLAVFVGEDVGRTTSAYADLVPDTLDPWDTARLLGGMLLVVQGFETSRYLGAHYDAAVRIRTMKYAQMASTVIYVVFIALMVPLFESFPAVIDDTAILDATREVTPLLVPLVIVAAAASQLSAGIADTAAGGGLIIGELRNHGEPRVGYTAVVFGAVTLIWVTDVFNIIAFASRAFAVYYLLQAVLAFLCAPRVLKGSRLVWKQASFAIVGSALAFIAAFGIPAG